MLSRSPFSLFLYLLLFFVCGQFVHAQIDYNRKPINYDTTPSTNAIYQLQLALEAGEIDLEWDKRLGWLPAVLKALEVPTNSQTLVFSKTSMQRTKISPSRPRALYYNDDVYVGYVRHGKNLELSAIDPELGAIFYTIDQENSQRPIITRDRGQCLSCHATRRTHGVPGTLVRSVFPDESGEPSFSLGAATTDHTTPLAERYGGWYVTGQHGKIRHRGNAIADPDATPPLDTEAGANRETLEGLVDTRSYLEPGSDIVSLMVLEHQAEMHNLFTYAAYKTRVAMFYNEVMNKSFNRPEGAISESAQRQIASAGEELLEYLFFSGEAELLSPIEGSSSFAAEFAAIGPRDSRGRSLRDFDLKTRMFKYPCSFLVYSDSFDKLPEELNAYLRRRITEVLTGEDMSEPFEHLSRRTRLAILEILRETKPERLL